MHLIVLKTRETASNLVEAVVANHGSALVGVTISRDHVILCVPAAEEFGTLCRVVGIDVVDAHI